MIFVAGAQLDEDGVLVPFAIHADIVGVEAGGGEGAGPTAKQPGLQRGEGGEAQLIAAARGGRPVEVFVLSARLLDQLDDHGLGPARPANDGVVIDAGLDDRIAVGAKMVRCR